MGNKADIFTYLVPYVSLFKIVTAICFIRNNDGFDYLNLNLWFKWPYAVFAHIVYFTISDPHDLFNRIINLEIIKVVLTVKKNSYYFTVSVLKKLIASD